MAETVIKIEGMTCGHCKMSVEKALKEVSGVEGVNVSLEEQKAVVKGSADQGALVKAVGEAGYSASVI